MVKIHWQILLIPYWWLAGLGLMIGMSIALDPFFRCGFYPDEDELTGILAMLFSLPYLVTTIIVLVPFLLIVAFQNLRKLSRLQWDLFLLFAIIATSFVNFWAWIHVHVTFILICLCYTILIMRAAMAGRFDVIILPIDKYLFVLLFFMLLSVFGPLGSPGLTISTTFAFFTSMVLPIILLHNVIRTRKQLMTAIRYMICLSIFFATMGIGQYLLFKFFGIDMTGSWNLDIGKTVVLPVVGTVRRVAGLTGNPNYLAFQSGTMTAMMSFMILQPDYFSRKWKRIFIIGIILGLTCSVFTASRGAWLALGICYIILPYIAFPKYRVRIFLGMVSIVFIGWLSGLFGYIYELVYNIRSSAMEYRGWIENIGIDAIINHPLTGVGFGAFDYYWNFVDDEVHNVWLNVASQVGIPAALVLLAYFLSLVIRLIRAVLHTTGFNRVILQSFFYGLVFFVIQAIVRPLIWDKFYWFYFCFLEVAIYILGKGKERSKVYYPVFGYSWRDEPLIQLEKK